MAFENNHTQEDWRYSQENLEITTSRKGILEGSKQVALVTTFDKDAEEYHANGMLISQSPKLREFAEMLYDHWSSQKKKPFLLDSLKETLIAAGVEITH